MPAASPADATTDPLHLLAYGSDASFYRLLPKAVIKVHSEGEVQGLLRLSQAYQVPVTFRAAGTSLSGQAVTDSIIISVVRGRVYLYLWRYNMFKIAVGNADATRRHLLS
jgi:FAD/FMN-containing dehydrogenase